MTYIKTTMQTEITPEFMAKCFCEMNNIEQVRFFSEVSKVAKREWQYYYTQLAYIGDVFDAEAKEFIMQLAENCK